jgi:hypothetical protein
MRDSHASLERRDDLCYPTGMRFVPFNLLRQRIAVAVTNGATTGCAWTGGLAGAGGAGRIT